MRTKFFLIKFVNMYDKASLYDITLLWDTARLSRVYTSNPWLRDLMEYMYVYILINVYIQHIYTRRLYAFLYRTIFHDTKRPCPFRLTVTTRLAQCSRSYWRLPGKPRSAVLCIYSHRSIPHSWAKFMLNSATLSTMFHGKHVYQPTFFILLILVNKRKILYIDDH